MQHTIPIHEIGPFGQSMARAVEACVHCGFCLPACPTYLALGEEMDSPRGRILLMKEVLEGSLKREDALPYLDRCLGCLGCVTACPSGVEYSHLITPFRALAEEKRRRTVCDAAVRRLVLWTLPYPGRFRLAALLGRLARPLRRLAPGRLGTMLDLLPSRVATSESLPSLYPAEGKRRARVALLAGCVQRTLAPRFNWATLRVLARNGVETVIPSAQSCCGALSAHTGALHQARKFARRNLSAFPDDVDAVLTNAAGCGSGMQEYGLWLEGEPDAETAKAFAARVRDVSAFLVDLGASSPGPLPKSLKVAYHDSCHLVHAQRVSSQPRRLLAMIPNLQILEVPEGEICCGSAGTYNLEQPEIANQLGKRKAAAILSTGAEAVAAGNIGCLVQIQAHLQQAGRPLPVYHTMELLDLAYGSSPTGFEEQER